MTHYVLYKRRKEQLNTQTSLNKASGGQAYTSMALTFCI